MRSALRSSVAAVTVLLALGGCGSSSGRPGHVNATTGLAERGSRTASSAAVKPQAGSLLVASAARRPDGSIDSRYTCRGAALSPPLAWSGIDVSAKEVVVVARTIAGGGVTTNWILAGIPPAEHSIVAGRTPPGAVVGRNSFGETGYRLCPPAHGPGLVTIAVYALPQPLRLSRGFWPSALGAALGHAHYRWGAVQFVVGDSHAHASYRPRHCGFTSSSCRSRMRRSAKPGSQ